MLTCDAEIWVEVWSGDVCLGTHLVQMYDPEHAFAVTGFTRPQAGYRQHLLTLLEHVPGLKGIQWINLNHARLEVTTVEADSEKI